MKLLSDSVCVALLGVLSLSSQGQDLQWRKQFGPDASLGVVRKLLLNQDVIVGGLVVELGGSVLLEWEDAQKYKDLDRYTTTFMSISGATTTHLPSSYKGKTARVIAVQLNSSNLGAKRNALGELIREEARVNPYFDVLVKFPDNRIAMTTAFPNTLTGQLELSSTATALSAIMNKELPLLAGQSLYAVGYSKLYKLDSTLEELQSPQRNQKELLSILVPRLVPLVIAGARHIVSVGIILKVVLPGGAEALAFTPQMYFDDSDPSKAFLARIAGTLIPEIPKNLSQRDLEAIKKRTIYKGMSANTVPLALGFPERKSDWSRGGQQLVFYGNMFVYVGQDNRVVDWQMLEN